MNSKWLRFSYEGTTGKTEWYHIYSKEGDHNLGTIKWYSSWRKYAFFPNPNCVFEKTCMQDITDFLTQLMNERKNSKANKEQEKT